MNAPTDLTMHSLWDDLLKVVLRRKRLVLVVAGIVAATVFGYLSFKGDRYEASASLLVKLGRANADVPLTVEKGTVHRDGVRKEEINTYISLIRSRPMLEATVDKIGVERFYEQPPPPKSWIKRIKYQAKQMVRWGKKQLTWVLIKVGLKPDLDDRELAVIFLQKSLAVEHEKDTNVINLSLRMADPFLAKEVLEVLIENYKEEHIEVVQQETSEDIFAEQVKADRERLGELRAQEQKLREELDIGDIGEQKTQLVRQIATLDGQIREADQKREALSTSMVDITSQLDRIEEQVLSSVTIKPSPALTKLKDRLSELRIKRAGDASKFQPGSNPLLMLDEEIAGIQNRILKEGLTEEGDRIMERNPLLDVLHARLAGVAVDLRSLNASAETATKQRKGLADELQGLNKAEGELSLLELEIQVANARFLTSSSRLEEAKSEAMLNQRSVSNISVYSAPSFSWKPVAPRRILIMIGGIVGGLAIGLGLALFLEWQSDVLHDPQDFKGIGNVAFLGTMKAD